jgi:hypothetical protein
MSVAQFPLASVPMLLRDSPVLAYGTFGGRPNRKITVQCTSVTAVAHTSATVTATVTDGYLPIAEGDEVTFGGIQGDDDLSQGAFPIAAVVSQNFQTGVVVFTVNVDTIIAGNIAGVAFIQPLPAAAETPNFGAYAVPEGCKGISWDTDGLNGSIQLEGALNVDGPWGIIGEAVTVEGPNIAMLPVGVRFVRINYTEISAAIVSWLSAF